MTNGGQHPDPSGFRIENEMDLLFGRAHPNPTREGCPPAELLPRLARRELPIDDPAYDHLGKCSPCYQELRAILQAEAARLPRRQPASRLSVQVSDSASEYPGTRMDIDTARRRIRQDFPCLTIARIELLGQGLGNIAFEVNETFVFRFPKAHLAIVDLERELLVLPVVRAHSTLPVPQPDFVPPDRSYVGYRKLPGRILMSFAEDISASGCAAMGRGLGAFLSSIHEIPAAAFHSSAVKRESLRPEDCLVSARDDYAKARKGIPTRYTAAVERFLDTSPADEDWSRDSLFSHNDLGSEHILVQNGIASGIIDWGDTAFTDPAYDFGLLYRDLGPTVLKASLEGYTRVDSAEKDLIRQRAYFYGRWRVLENIAYGLEPQHSPYLDAALRSLTWLFP